MKLSGRFLSEIDMAHRMLGNSTSWIDFKKVLLKSLPHSLRNKFSTRDPKTKTQSLNMFEHKLVDIYKSRTGVQLKLGD